MKSPSANKPFEDPKVIRDPYYIVFIGHLSLSTNIDTFNKVMVEKF